MLADGIGPSRLADTRFGRDRVASALAAAHSAYERSAQPEARALTRLAHNVCNRLLEAFQIRDHLGSLNPESAVERSFAQ